MKIKKISASLAVILAILSFSGCTKQNDAKMKRPMASVDVALPVKRAVELWDEYTARIDGEKSVEIRARVNGYLEKKCFKDGDYVKAGDVLFEIDPRPFQAVVNACKAQVKEAESRVALAKSNYERASDLYKAKAISKEVLDTRHAEVLMADANLSLVKAKLVENELNLEFTKVVSPVSGYVSRRFIDEGNLVSASGTLLAKVVSRDTVYVYFEASERDAIKYMKSSIFKDIEKNKVPVKIKLMGEDEFSHTGYLSYVGNALNTLNLELRADVSNKDSRLLPGMYAKAALLFSKSSESLLVPETSVGTDLVGRYVVIVDEKNIVKYVPVKVGELIDQMRVIQSGLQGNEKIIIDGLQRAIPNSEVKSNLIELKK